MMKYVPYLSAAILLFVSAGCESSSDGDSPNVAPAAISGSSGLDVQNNSDDPSNIYFDDMFIGRVEPTTTGKWSVPHGLHRVRITNAVKNNVIPLQAEYSFPGGGRVILELKFTPRTSSSAAYNNKD